MEAGRPLIGMADCQQLGLAYRTLQAPAQLSQMTAESTQALQAGFVECGRDEAL